MKYLIDAYAWVEYLTGGKLGEKVRELILSDNEIISLNITIAEVVSKIKRKKENAEIAYNAINSNSQIISITPEIAKEAGIIYGSLEKKGETIGPEDCMIIGIVKTNKEAILTKDKHFQRFTNIKKEII